MNTNTNFERNAGVALIIFSVLMIFTMVLHPAGGNFEHLQKVKEQIILTHAIALLSLPFGLMGCWGLTRKFGTDNFLAMTGFSFICFGLFAVVIAAATNGLVLPIFIERYSDANPDTITSLKSVMRYSFSVNEAFDYIYTGAFCLAIMAWSMAILITKRFPTWIAWMGIVLSGVIVTIFASGFSVVSVQQFRMFVSGVVLWIVIVGGYLARKS